MKRIKHLILPGMAALLLASCTGVPERGVDAAGGGATYASDERADVPAGPADIRTTSPDIYVGNLDGRIDSLERAASTRDAPRLRLMLGESLAHRSRLLGRPGDHDRALSHANAVLETDPDNSGALLLRARLQAAQHRFDDALANLGSARQAGTPAARVDRQRAEVLVALGRVADGEALARPHLKDDLADLAFRANRLVDQGQLEAADELFVRAQDAYQDSSPYALAWLHVQHGVLFLRAGDHQRAARFFAAAHERLPDYYLAAEHLAETRALLGDFEGAAKLYREVAAQTDDPVFHAALADVEEQLGRDDAAGAAEQKARSGFEAWLEEQPRAAWQHAAEYYLDRGETARAADLARRNAELRQNVGSLLLLARAEQAAGNNAAACQAWQRARETGLNPPEFGELSGRFEEC